jgi:Rho termination factor, N-terminal domain
MADILNPYVSEEEQDMEMEPIVLGPPGYASPDPETNAAALVPLSETTLEVSPDFGKDAAAEGEESLEDMTKAELVEKAEAEGIEGAASMNKSELVEALKA